MGMSRCFSCNITEVHDSKCTMTIRNIKMGRVGAVAPVCWVVYFAAVSCAAHSAPPPTWSFHSLCLQASVCDAALLPWRMWSPGEENTTY